MNIKAEWSPAIWQHGSQAIGSLVYRCYELNAAEKNKRAVSIYAFTTVWIAYSL